MRYFLLVVIILSVCVKSFSQTKITGRVADKDGRAMEGFVTLNIPGESNILSFADIDECMLLTIMGVLTAFAYVCRDSK